MSVNPNLVSEWAYLHSCMDDFTPCHDSTSMTTFRWGTKHRQNLTFTDRPENFTSGRIWTGDMNKTKNTCIRMCSDEKWRSEMTKVLEIDHSASLCYCLLPLWLVIIFVSLAALNNTISHFNHTRNTTHPPDTFFQSSKTTQWWKCSILLNNTSNFLGTTKTWVRTLNTHTLLIIAAVTSLEEITWLLM